MVFWAPVDEDGSYAFADVVAPFAREVLEAVTRNPSWAKARISEDDVLGDADRRLAALLTDPLYRRFLALRSAHAQRSRAFTFESFVERMLDGEMEQLLEHRPALHRLVRRVVTNATDAWADIAECVARDRSLLAAANLIPAESDQPISVTPGHGDFHDGGRSATELCFASGSSVFLKPRPGTADMIWRSLVERVAVEVGIRIETLEILDRETHHWSRAVAHERSEGESLVEFYVQAGALAFLTYLLQGIDFHCENLIATASGPVVVDLEGILHPAETPPAELEPATSAAFSRLVGSVVNTGMLPCLLGGDGNSGSLGALNPPIQVTTRRVAVLDPGTARLRLEWREYSDSWTDHTPLNDGQGFELEWISGVQTGFRRTYEAFQRGSLHGALQATLEELADAEVRFIARPTALYYNALHHLLAAAYEPHDVDEATVLSTFLATLPDYGQGSRLVPFEIEALSQCDIPRFSRRGGELQATLAGFGPASITAPASPKASVSQRLASLSMEDLQFQESLLSASFGGVAPPPTLNRSDLPPLAPSNLIDAAVACGRTLLDSCIRVEGSVAWLSSVPGPAGRNSITVCGVDLYAGLSGVGLFLAELWRTTGEQVFGDVARRCVATIGDRLEREDLLSGLGAGSGVGGVVYALSHPAFAELDTQAAEIARQLVCLFPVDSVITDSYFDVMDGSAGLLLGLLAARHIEHRQELEEACVHSLLEGLKMAQTRGLQSWETFEAGVPHSGFAHGSSGIAAALARFYALRPDSAVLRAVQTAIAFDNQVDLSDPHLPVQWCHGAPGIALAHGVVLESIPALAPSLEPLVQRALRATLDAADAQTDGVCCGAMGSVAALFHGATDSSYAQPQEELLAAIVESRRLHGAYRWSAGPDRVGPALFTGVSGIGLELLLIAADRRGATPLMFSH